ncbi:sialate O-acetylesterase [Pholidichthys leucotaenia]
MSVTLGVVFVLLASVHHSDGRVSFASYYGDHMVLQKAPERAVLWGSGPEGAQVTVALSGPSKQKTLVSVTNGIWRVILNPVEVGGPYNVTASTQDDTANLTDVLFGDIWLCGGQSNMEFHVSQVFNSSVELALASKYPHVRPFMVSKEASEIELNDLIQVGIPWSVPTAEVLTNFSAVCWLFGRYMYEKLQYPIGLVESCYGGTAVECWSSSRALKQCGFELNSLFNDSVLWNAMIHPLLNMTIKGAIWYQGEANAEHNQVKYNCSFPAMIDDWRMAFHQGSGGQTAPDFPFGFVQLCTFKQGSTTDGFREIRWHQSADFGYAPNPRMKRTFMAVALDLPDKDSPYSTIHPRDKQDVAYRLTLGARAVAYNEKNVSFCGPFPEEIVVSQMYVNITYDQAINVTPSKDVFEICCSEIQAPCGNESTWVQAPTMYWSSTTVQLSATFCESRMIAGLRYAWSDWPCGFKACPVYSTSGILPAPPFITSRYGDKRNIWRVSEP